MTMTFGKVCASILVLHSGCIGNCHFTHNINHDTNTWPNPEYRYQPIAFIVFSGGIRPMSSTPSGPEHSSPALQVLPTCSRCASTECGPPGPPWTHNDGCKIPRSSTLEVQITRGRSVPYYGPWCHSFHKKAGLFNSIQNHTKTSQNVSQRQGKYHRNC